MLQKLSQLFLRYWRAEVDYFEQMLFPTLASGNYWLECRNLMNQGFESTQFSDFNILIIWLVLNFSFHVFLTHIPYVSFFYSKHEIFHWTLRYQRFSVFSNKTYDFQISWVVVIQMETMHWHSTNSNLMASSKMKNNILKAIVLPCYREWLNSFKTEAVII